MSQKIPYYYALPAIILSTLLVVVIVLAWTEPSQAPPGGNVSTPLNVGSVSQYKSGALGIGGLFRAWSDAIFDGNVGIGTTNPKSPAPNNQGSNLDVNDVYLRSINQWVSQLGGGGNCSFGSRSATLSRGTVYYADTDGLVVFSGYTTNPNPNAQANFWMFADTSSDPTTEVMKSVSAKLSTSNSLASIAVFTVPVKKGEYYKITGVGDPAVYHYYFVPCTGGGSYKWLSTPVLLKNWTWYMSWTDIDISPYTGSDTVSAAILQTDMSIGVVQGRNGNGWLKFRPKGAVTDTGVPMLWVKFDNSAGEYNMGSAGSGQYLVQCDASRVFQMAASGNGLYAMAGNVYLVGYIK